MYRRILLAYDGSSFSAEALREGTELASLCHAELHILCVVDRSGGFALAEGAASGSLSEEEILEAQRALQEALAAVRSAGVTAASSLRFGNPATEIRACAREVQADLVVIGHGGKGMVTRWLQGSVGVALVDHLPCSLLVAVPAGGER